MDEKRLSKIALLCSLTGILLLLVIAERQDLSTSSIASITNETLNQPVLIKGKITSIKETPAVAIAQVQDTTGSITVIMFRKENMVMQKGDLVEVEGVIKEFNDKLEIETKVVKLF